MNWGTLLPVVTLVLGYAGSIMTEERREQRALRRELASAQRQSRRDVLRDMQDTLALLYMADVQKFAAETVHFNTTQSFEIKPIPVDWRGKHDEALPRLWILRSVIADARVIELMDQWDVGTSKFAHAKDFNDAEGSLAYEGVILKLIIARAGELVLALDREALADLSDGRSWQFWRRPNRHASAATAARVEPPSPPTA